MWHASTAPTTTLRLAEATLRRYALAALDGVGDPALGEWEDWTGRAFHVRRRLTAEECVTVGSVIDVRGTPDAGRRLAVVRPLLPKGYTE